MGKQHAALVGNENHAITANPNAAGTSYANIAARDADSSFHGVAANVNKVVRVDSPLSFYVLTAITPTWLEFSSTAALGDVLKVGTPVDNQIGVWTGDGTLEGDTNLTFDGTRLSTIGLLVGNGTELLPAYSFTSDPDTGMRRVSADVLGFSAKGFDVLQLTATATATNFLSVTAQDNDSGGFDNGIPLLLEPGSNLTQCSLELRAKGGAELSLNIHASAGSVNIGRSLNGTGIITINPDNRNIGFGATGSGDFSDGQIAVFRAISPDQTKTKIKIESPNSSSDIFIGINNDVETSADIGVVDSNTFNRASGSFITDGFVIGQTIVSTGHSNAQNNGTFTTAVVTALTLDITTSPLTSELSTGGEKLRELNTGDAFIITTGEELIISSSAGEVARFTGLDMGLGITSPAERLHLGSTVSGTPNILRIEHTLTANADVTQGIHLYKDLNGGLFGWKIESSGVLDGSSTLKITGRNSGAVEIVHVSINRSSGNFGLGIDVPTSKLHVVGDARVTGAFLDSSGGVGTSGQVLSSTVAGTDWIDTGLGDVTKVGTPVDNQVGIWTGPGTLEGDADLTFDGARLAIGGSAPLTDLTIFQKAGNLKGLTLSGVGVTNTSTTQGVSLLIGNNSVGNTQLWICNAVDQGNAAKNCFRFITGQDVPLIVGVNNIGTVNRNLAFGINSLGAGVAVGFPTSLAQAGVLAKLHVSTGVASEIGMMVQGVTSQTANLFEARNSAAAIVFAINSAGQVDAKTQKIINVVDPTLAQDVATKNYADTSTANGMWTKTGSTVHGTVLSDSVGIGVNTASATLNVKAASLSTIGLIVETPGVPTVDLFQIRNSVGGAEVVVDESFRMGVGTSNPTACLHVTNVLSNDSFRVDDQTSETTPFIIDNSGNVGIGLAVPTVKLHVIGAGKFTGALDMTSGLINNVLDPVSAQDAATKNYVDTQGFGDVFKVGTPLDNQIGVWTGDGTLEGDADLVFDGVHLGIGVPAPLSKVDIQTESVGEVGLRVKGFGVQTANLFQVRDSVDTALFDIDATGKVGIGIVSPAARLDIQAGGGGAVIGLRVQGVLAQTADLFQARAFSGAVLVSIDDMGNMSVGDSTSNSRLHIHGSFSVERTSVAGSMSTVDEMIIGVTSTASLVTVTIMTTDIVEGRLYVIKDESGAASVNNITIATQGSQTIDGVSTVAITEDYGVVRLYSDGINLFSW